MVRLTCAFLPQNFRGEKNWNNNHDARETFYHYLHLHLAIPDGIGLSVISRKEIHPDIAMKAKKKLSGDTKLIMAIFIVAYLIAILQPPAWVCAVVIAVEVVVSTYWFCCRKNEAERFIAGK
jgi:hypothetical protein